MEIIYSTIWLIIEWINLFLLVGPLSILFYLKFKKDKSIDDKLGLAFNFRNLIFFILTALNHLIFMIESLDLYKNSIIGWNQIFGIEIRFNFIFEIAFNSQNMIMATLFLFSFALIIYPMERYSQKWKSLPITKLLIIGGTMIGILWLVLCILNLQFILDFLIFQLLIFIFFIIGVLGIIIGFIGFFLLYVKLAIKSTGVIRKKAIFIAIGVILLTYSVFIGNLSRPSSIGTPLELLGPISMLFGILILLLGFKLKT